MVIVALDTNVVVALVDDRDTWHGTAVAMRDALLAIQAQLVYFDCVFNETMALSDGVLQSRNVPSSSIAC